MKSGWRHRTVGRRRGLADKNTKKLNTIYTTGRIRHSEKRRVRSGKIRIRKPDPAQRRRRADKSGNFQGPGAGNCTGDGWRARKHSPKPDNGRRRPSVGGFNQSANRRWTNRSTKIEVSHTRPEAGGRSGRSLPADGAAREIGTLKVAAHKIETRRIAAHKIRGRRAAAPKIGIRRAAFREIGVRRAAAREIGVRRAAAPGLRVEIPNDNAGRG